MYSKLDPIPYLEYEWDSNELEGTSDNKNVRRQISDCWEYDSDYKAFVSDSRAYNTKINPEDSMLPGKVLSSNFSQSYYKNFLNHLKEDEPVDKMAKTGFKLHPKQDNKSKNPALDNYIKSGKTIKDKKNSFLKVEEFRQSKQFRENQIPTNTSFSGVDKSQINNVSVPYYTYMSNTYQQKNKSFDLINYQSKRKSKFSKRNNKTHNFYYNVNELLKNAATANPKTVKGGKKRESVSKDRQKKWIPDSKGMPIKASTFNKRQMFTQNKLYQRRSVTTTRGTDISPQVRNGQRNGVQRPTSSSGVEGSKRNQWMKECSKQESMLLKSNPLDLYEFREGNDKR